MAIGGRLLRAALVLALLLPLSAVGSLAAQAVSAGAQVGDTKTPCAYTSDSIAALQRFSDQVGRPVDCALLFSDNTVDWDTWEQPWLIHTNITDYQWPVWAQAKAGRRLVVTQSMVPMGLSDDWRAQGASGAYDDHVRAWAANMVNGGYGSATIRLGHEANGDWYFDSIGDTAQDSADWAAYWARFVRIARSVPGAQFAFDWDVNAGYRRIPFAQFYPGDDVVDIIGIDQYDGLAIAPNPPPATPQDRWDAVLHQQWGLSDLVDFAGAHGKPLSIPEYGLLTPTAANGTGGGDDPTFIDGIAGIVRDHVTSYSSVWDRDSPTSPNAVAIEDGAASMASYRSHFGPTGDALVGAAPAVAPPPATAVTPPVSAISTSIVAKASARVVKVGALVRISGLLVGGGAAIVGQTLLLQRLVHRHWSVVAKAVTDRRGRATLSQRPGRTTQYRVRFTGSAPRLASASLVLTVRVTPKR